MYIELIASVSSELLFLSMQQVSTQKYSSPSTAACFAQNCIFLHPALFTILLLSLPFFKS